MYRLEEFLEAVASPQHKYISDAWKGITLEWEPDSAVWFPGAVKQGLNRRAVRKLNNLRNEFCKQTCGGRVHQLTMTVWLFERKGDAMLFFMRWKGITE